MSYVSRNQQGFTILEVMIASAIFPVVLLAAYLMYDTNTWTYVRGGVKTDIQQNARVALAALQRDLRLAGYGVPPIPCPGAIASIIDARPSSITFRADLQNISTTLSAQANTGANSLSVASVTGFQVNDVIYLTNGVQCQSMTITSVTQVAGATSGTLGISPNVSGASYAIGSRVLRPKDVTYDVVGDQLRKDERRVGAPPSATPDVLADKIQGFTLRYFNGAGVDITANPVANPSAIRRIQVEIVAWDIPVGQQNLTYRLRSDVSPRNL